MIQRRVAIIGGGSKGLGKGCAVELSKKGINIVICSRNKDQLFETASEIEQNGVEVLPFVGDMSIANDNIRLVNETIKRFGRIDILINNSGGPAPGNYKAFNDTDWEKAFQSVLMYTIRLSTLVIPHMEKNKWGRIINIASLSVKEPAESLILSNVFRAGILAFSKSISKDLIKKNITINTLCPGAFKTDRAIELMNKVAQEKGISISEVESENIKNLPLGRYQSPEELGALAAFFCSDLAGGITGVTMQIDGGISNSLL